MTGDLAEQVGDAAPFIYYAALIYGSYAAIAITLVIKGRINQKKQLAQYEAEYATGVYLCAEIDPDNSS